MPQAHQLGRYHLLDRIAYGGMAEIFRAKTFDAKGTVHFVAVKRLLQHLVTDDEFLQMLVDEAKICALLQHTNIARVYEFANVGDEYFLAMEYVDGKDVRALLEKGRQAGQPIPAEHAAWIAMECATALHAAHVQRDRQGAALRIVHRDVSPSNILCSYRGDVKLCDFGIAKATLTRVQTKTGVIKGKVKYMSPEQAMGRKLDHRSDLFSLGTVLYEMLTLQAPFVAPTEVELIFAVRDARKRPVRDLAPEVPEALADLVDRAMTRSRSARFQSGEEMALALRQFLDEHKPGYRRSHFSRFMRRQFDGEIERELRVLEGYTIEQADSVHLGENLIADVLDPDAPFTRFTPAFGRAPSGAPPPRPPPRARELHDRQTVILDPRGGLVADDPLSSMKIHPADLPQLSTHLKQPPTLHQERTRLFDTRDVARRRAALGGHGRRDIHDEETGEKRIPGARRARPATDDGDFHAQSTVIIDGFHAAPTQAPAATEPPAPATPDAPAAGGRPPLAAEPTGIVRRRRLEPRPLDRAPDDEDDADELTSLPLDDADLEEI